MTKRRIWKMLSVLLIAVYIPFLLGDAVLAVQFSANKKTMMYRGEIPVVIDYDRGVIISQGREFSIPVDGVTWEDIKNSLKGVDSYVTLVYDRFDVHIETEYYNNNVAELNEFFDLFEPRYELLESITGWSSEKFWSQKLQIYVYGGPSCGIGGWAIAGEAHVTLPDPLYQEACKKPYYDEFNGTPLFGNLGELGDYWYLMGGTMHEALHAINPLPIVVRPWLTEGFSDYYYYNLLTDYGDINQETSDTYIYKGRPGFRWEEYVTNDYHDTTGNENEIQASGGYTITSWMFSMMRDDYGLPWNSFWDLLNSNLETLYESYVLGDYFTDRCVIDLFERVTGIEMYPIFRYDGPEGPGWGVRHWTDLDWYADLTPEISLSADTVFVGDTVSVQASVFNNGGVSLDSVSVRFYEGSNLIDEQFVDFPCSTMSPVSIDFAADGGNYTISVRVDEDGIKIESDEQNNDASADMTFLTWYCGDADGSGSVDIDDVVHLINYIFAGGPAPEPLAAGDADCSGDVDIDDVVYLINYIFAGGPAPCDPDGDEIPDC